MQKLTPEAVKESDLAGEPVTTKLTRAPGNNAPIGGSNIVARSGFLAARSSAIIKEAEEIVSNAWGCLPVPPRCAIVAFAYR